MNTIEQYTNSHEIPLNVICNNKSPASGWK
jgi:hypothetical protein